MSHILFAHSLPSFDETHLGVFSMARRPFEFEVNRYGLAIMSATSALVDVYSAANVDSLDLHVKIPRAIGALDHARKSLEAMACEEARRSTTVFPRPIVRYDLVGDEGRSAGVGYIANRALERRLDVCRLHLANADGLVADKCWASILNSTSGVATWLKVWHLKNGQFTGFDENRGLRENKALIECEMVRELLLGVPSSVISAAAEQFIEELEGNKVTTLAKRLADEVRSSREQYPEHFIDHSSRPAREFPMRDLSTVLQRKLRTLRERLGGQGD